MEKVYQNNFIHFNLSFALVVFSNNLYPFWQKDKKDGFSKKFQCKLL